MRILAPLRLPQLALLWGGLALSAVGDQLYAVALSWIAVGVLGAAEALALPHGLLLPAYVAVAGITAFGGPMGDIPIAVLRQTELPRADLPPAMPAFMVVNNAGTLLAMLAAPALFARLPAGIVIGGSGLAIVAIGLAGLRRCRRLESRATYGAATSGLKRRSNISSPRRRKASLRLAGGR